MVSFKQVMLVGTMVALIAACSGDDEADDQALTTTTAGASITTLADTDASGTEAAVAATTTTTTTTEPPELAFPEYQIVSRETNETGDLVVVLLDTESYESLSDIDIHNVMSDLVNQYAPVNEAHLVESQAAADALFVDDLTPEQQTELEAHYIARLEEGFRIVYVGRFAETGVAILGS